MSIIKKIFIITFFLIAIIVFLYDDEKLKENNEIVSKIPEESGKIGPDPAFNGFKLNNSFALIPPQKKEKKKKKKNGIINSMKKKFIPKKPRLYEYEYNVTDKKSGKVLSNVTYTIKSYNENRLLDSNISSNGKISTKLPQGLYIISLVKKSYYSDEFDFTIPMVKNEYFDNFKLRKKSLIKRVVDALTGKG